MTSSSEAALGALAALGSAVAWAVTSLLVRRLSSTLTSLMVNALRSVLGGGLLLAWVLLRKGPDELAVSAQSFLLLVVSIVIAVGVGDTLFFESSRRLGIARAMTVSMTYPLIATLMAARTVTSMKPSASPGKTCWTCLIRRSMSIAPPAPSRRS